MMHVYFGNTKPKITFGIEASIYFFWIRPIESAGSIDMGWETGKDVTVLYTEIQAARSTPIDNDLIAMFSGISMGIFKKWEKKDNEKHNLVGFQMTLWGAYFLGADLRIRLSKEHFSGGPGIFFKHPAWPMKIGT